MTPSSIQRNLPVFTPNTPAAEYVMAALKIHESKTERSWFDRTFYPAFNWIGNAMLSVAPINRLCSAIGLTVGLGIGGEAARLVAGQRFDGVVTTAPKGILGKLHGILNYDPVKNDGATKIKRFAMYAIFSLGGFIGVILGSKFAYRSTYKQNRHPNFLEEYDARATQEQGDSWLPFTGFSAIFGSASGYAFLPLPGINYAVSLSSRTVLMQNRNNMTPGLHKWASGTPTSSTYGVREGLKNLVDYAVNNPSETPTLLEYKSFHILGQLFPTVRAEHVHRFVNKLHELRDPYLAPGGVPKEKRKELHELLTQHFTKAGFETTLIEIGLNPRAVELTNISGAIGRVGNRLGAKSKILKLQEEYHKKLDERHPDLPKDKIFLEPTVGGDTPIAAAEPTTDAPRKLFANLDLRKPLLSQNAERSALSHADRSLTLTESTVTQGMA